MIVPAVAVIVAMRLLAFVVPDENVTCALPKASVVTVPEERIPVSAEKFTTTLGSAALAAESAVAVIVIVFELSDLTLVADAERLRALATGGGGVAGVVVGVPDPPPPHALRRVATNHKPHSDLTVEEILITRTPAAY